MIAIDVIMATFNRPETTARCLASLEEGAKAADVRVRVFVADASTNELTVDACRNFRGEIHVTRLPSSFHWAAAMRRAWECASAEPGDLLCWLNDDVTLAPHAIETLVETVRRNERCVAGGAMVGRSGATTYSGYRRGPFYRRLQFSQLPLATHAQECDALNGNLVMTTWQTDREIGGFPKRYSHGLADFAYTLDARRRGIPVLLAPGAAGECALNMSAGGGWDDRNLSRRERWRRLNSSKGLPFLEWGHFCARNGGISALVYAALPWFRVIAGR